MHDDRHSIPERQYRDYIDMAASMWADENAALRDELRETQIDRDAYRVTLQESLGVLAKVTHERNQARRQLCVLREIRRIELHAQAKVSDAGAAA